jgi:pectinesterase
MVVVVVLPAMGVATAQTSAPATSPGYTVVREVHYINGPNGALGADVYVPDGAGPFPGILYIHGGGWKSGDRSQMVKLITALAAKGYVGFTIDYDLSPGVHYPVAFHESLAGLKYFRAHAAEYKLDAGRVAVAGSSAGGELTGLVALNPGGAAPGEKADPRISASPVQAALILNGVLDLSAQDTKSTSVPDYLGGTCAQRPEACKDASPIAHVHAGAPPIYVGHGNADESVPFHEAEEFTAALKKAGVTVQFFVAEGGPHTYWGKPKYFDDNLKAMEDFLAQALGPKSK